MSLKCGSIPDGTIKNVILMSRVLYFSFFFQWLTTDNAVQVINKYRTLSNHPPTIEITQHLVVGNRDSHTTQPTCAITRFRTFWKKQWNTGNNKYQLKEEHVLNKFNKIKKFGISFNQILEKLTIKSDVVQ
jgi:hypothetical protein